MVKLSAKGGLRVACVGAIADSSVCCSHFERWCRCANREGDVLIEQIRRTWNQLKTAEPGQRFVEYYQAHHAGPRRRSRLFGIGLGILLIILGIIAIPTPIIPGSVPIAVGAALLARESASVARLLDWLERSLRRAGNSLYSKWRGASPAARAMISVVVVGLVALGGWLAYQLVRRV